MFICMSKYVTHVWTNFGIRAIFVIRIFLCKNIWQLVSYQACADEKYISYAAHIQLEGLESEKIYRDAN